MSENDRVEAVAAGIAAAAWNARVALVRKIPEEFGKAQHQAVYAAVAKAVYVSELAPDFAYVHWRDEYELKPIERAYEKAASAPLRRSIPAAARCNVGQARRSFRGRGRKTAD